MYFLGFAALIFIDTLLLRIMEEKFILLSLLAINFAFLIKSLENLVKEMSRD